MRVGLLYNSSSLPEKFLFEGLTKSFISVGIHADIFSPFKEFTHILVHESQYDLQKENLDKHKTLGQKIIIFTPQQESPLKEIVISSDKKTKHKFIDLGVFYKPKIKRKKFIRLCWIGDRKEIEDTSEIQEIISNSGIPFDIISLSDFPATTFKGVTYKVFNETSFDTDSIVISTSDYVTLECLVRGITCLQLHSGGKIFSKLSEKVPEHLKEFCKEYKSSQQILDTIELLKLTDRLFDPLIKQLRSEILKSYLLNYRIIEYVEFFDGL